MQLPDWYAGLQSKACAVEKQFLPYGVDSAQDGLFNLEHPMQFVPNQAQLHACLSAYSDLLSQALVRADSADTTELAVDALVEASELVLVYLNQNDPAVIAESELAQQVASQMHALIHRSPEPELDAVGRIIAIGRLLAQQGQAQFRYP